MAGILGLSLILISGVLFVSGEESPIELTLTPAGVLKKGDEFTITCVVKEMGDFDVINIIRTIENPETGQDESVTLLTNGNVDKNFLGTNRYSAETDYDTSTFSLTIKDARGEDGGDIGCDWMDGTAKRETAMEYVQIYVPIEKLQIRSKSTSGEWIPVEDEGIVVMREDADDGVECYVEVHGSDRDVKPKITFTIGDIDGKTYKHVEHDSEFEQSIANKQLTRVFRTWYKFENKKPDRSFNDKDITCSASIAEYDEITTTATLSIQYKPEVACRETTYSKVGLENVRVTCEASMNPAPTSSFWTWGDGVNKTMLNTGDLIEGFSAEQTQQDDNKWEFHLVVAKVDASMLQTYHFSVENGLGGPVQKTARLEEVSTTTEPTTTTTTTSSTTTKSISEAPNRDPEMNPVIGESGNGSLQSLMSVSTVAAVLLLSVVLL